MGKTKLAALILSALIGLGAYVVGGEELTKAIQIAFDKDAALTYCGTLLEGE